MAGVAISAAIAATFQVFRMDVPLKNARTLSQRLLRASAHSDVRDRLRRHAFAAADEAQPFGRSCLDADLADPNAKDFRNSRAHCGPIRADFGLLRNDRAIDVVDDTATLSDQGDRMEQEVVR